MYQILIVEDDISLNNGILLSLNGFDTDKLVSRFVAADFTIANANYFNVNKGFHSEEDVPSEELICEVMKQDGIQAAGRIYYDVKLVLMKYTQEMVDSLYGDVPKDELDSYFFHIHSEDSKDGRIQLYGMDDMALNKLEVIEGTLDMEKLKLGKCIIEIALTDDYDQPFWETVFYHPGDKVELDYIEEIDYTGKGDTKYRSKTYEVMAVVKDNYGLNVRYYMGAPVLILPSNSFLEDTKTSTTMSYLIDVEVISEASIEQFLKDYTGKVDPNMSYNSKETQKKNLHNLRICF